MQPGETQEGRELHAYRTEPDPGEDTKDPEPRADSQGQPVN